MDAQRALIDALLGANRNAAVVERPQETLHWSDARVCRQYLTDYCTHELFTNTRSDLGPCPKAHDEQAKREFAAACERDAALKERCELEFLRVMENLVEENEKRIRKQRQRVALEQQAEIKRDYTPEEREQLRVLEEQIQSLVAQMQQLGEQGKLEESEALLTVVESLRSKKAAIEAPIEDAIAARIAAERARRNDVCEICGAMTTSVEPESRVQSHIEGRLHQGYLRLKESIKAYHARLASVLQGRPAAAVAVATAPIAAAPRRSRSRQRSRSPRRRRSRSRSRDRRRRRSRSHSRRRTRSSSSSRSRSRSRSSRSRSRSRRRGRRSRRSRSRS